MVLDHCTEYDVPIQVVFVGEVGSCMVGIRYSRTSLEYKVRLLQARQGHRPNELVPIELQSGGSKSRQRRLLLWTNHCASSLRGVSGARPDKSNRVSGVQNKIHSSTLYSLSLLGTR